MCVLHIKLYPINKLVLLIVLYFTFVKAQNVNILDVNFKNSLLNQNPVIDVVEDNEISTAEAEAFIGTINVSMDESIAD